MIFYVDSLTLIILRNQISSTILMSYYIDRNSFLLGVITCCILLQSIYFICDLKNNNQKEVPIIESSNPTVYEYNSLPSNISSLNRNIGTNIFRINDELLTTNNLDDKVDCNNHTYLSLKRQYINEGGIIFRSCSLPTHTINNAAHYTNSIPNRGGDAYRKEHSVQNIAADNDTIEFLKYLHNRGVFPFQTINFRIGTEQPIHR